MNNNKYIDLLSIVCMACSFISCSDNLQGDSSAGEYNNSDNQLYFDVSINQDWEEKSNSAQTRAIKSFTAEPLKVTSDLDKEFTIQPTVVNGINSMPIDRATTRSKGVVSGQADIAGFGVFAFRHANGSTNRTCTINNEQASLVSGSTVYTTNTNYFWPSSDLMDFFLYYPYNSSLLTITNTGTPTIKYTVPEDVAGQIDILGSTINNQTKGSNAAYKQAVNFSHLLTAVTFSIGEGLDPGTITSISISKVATTGTYTAGGSWSTAGSATKTYTLSNLNFSTENKKNTSITTFANSKAFLMIPQTLSGSVITITFKDIAGTSHTIASSISGQTWTAGTTVDYKISLNTANWEWVLTADNQEAPYTGGTATSNITSYHYNKVTKEKIAAKWNVVGYSTNGITYSTTKPSWVSLSTTSGNGGGSPNTMDVYAAPQSITKTANVDEAQIKTALKNNRYVTSSAASRWDLSLHGFYGTTTTRNTANCYVINSPGYYKIPLVYGNAITNGAVNNTVFSNSPALNYKDAKITTPYIRDCGTAPNNCCLIWEDSKDLITNVGISYNASITNSSNADYAGYLTFQIDEANINQGNAIVAVRDASNNIMWSWQIWVTNDNYTNTIEVTNHDGVKFDVMPLNLGWCSYNEEMRYYGNAQRTCYVKVSNSGKEAIFEVTQRYGTLSFAASKGSNCYYQHGRKDPSCPIDSSGTYKTLYTNNSSYTFKYQNLSVSTQTIGSGIKTPYTFYCVDASASWCKNSYTNLWKGGDTSYDNAELTSFTKTIYDPSPVGFKVAGIATFTGFTKDGVSGYDDDVNVSSKTAVSVGNYFYTNSLKNAEILLPATGFLTTPYWNLHVTPGQIVAWGVICDVWGAEATTESAGDTKQQGYSGTFMYSSVNPNGRIICTPHSYCFSSLGLAVRSVKE